MKNSASDILDFCLSARRRMFRKNSLREELEEYYNSGDIPTDCCTRRLQSLGLGNRHMRTPHKLLRATLEHDEGPVKVDVYGLDDLDRVEGTRQAIEKSLTDWCVSNYRTRCAQIAGEYLLFGRAFAFRLSKWDAKFRCGRPLHAADASTDIADDSFFSWAFPYKLTLREIDVLLETARGEENKGGWQKKALQSLKRHILELRHSERYKGERNAPPFRASSVNDPFPADMWNDPLMCYAYFEKSEKREGVHRKVHLKIVSRMSEDAAIASTEEKDDRTRTIKQRTTYSIKVKDEGNEHIIYSELNAFDSVHQCLIPFIEDARVSGQQLMDEVAGDGEQFLNRLVRMEEMMDSATSGTSFAMQPHFVWNNGVDKATKKRLQETRLPPYSHLPPGTVIADKSNVINSSRAGLDMVQALGLSVEEEAATNKLPQVMGQRTRSEFAAEADQVQQAAQETVMLRFKFWHAGWSDLWQQVGETLTRLNGWAKADASYYDNQEFRKKFEECGGRMADLRKARLKFRSRQLPGGADRQTAMQRFMMVINNPHAPAKHQQWASREIFKLMFGAETAEQLDRGEKKPSRDQIETAMLQTNAALISYLPMTPEPGDDPLVHLLQVHGPVLQQRAQMAAQKGFRTPEETAGFEALVQHSSFDIANLPGASRESAIAALTQLVNGFASVPEQRPFDEGEQARQKMQLDAMRVQNEVANGENLRQNRNAQLAQKSENAIFDQFAKAKSLGQQDIRIGIERDKAMQEAASELLSA